MPMQTKIGDASLKFGPDWLRALSSDNSTGSTVSTSTGGGQSGGGWSSGSGGGGGSGERVSNERGSVAPYRHQPTRDREKEVERRYSNQNSSSNNAGGAAAAAQNRFKLAEFRYAREELLTLYDKNLQAPHSWLPLGHSSWKRCNRLSLFHNHLRKSSVLGLPLSLNHLGLVRTAQWDRECLL